MLALVKTDEHCSMILRGHWRYVKYASLCYLPRDLMSQTGNPSAAAVVAAPIRKLWLEYDSARLLQQAADHVGNVFSG